MSDAPATTGKRLLTIAETAQQLSLSSRTIRRLVGLKELGVVRCGRSVRIKADSVQAFIERGGTR